MGKYDELSLEQLEEAKEKLELKRNRLDTKQLTIKVLINSAYGWTKMPLLIEILRWKLL